MRYHRTPVLGGRQSGSQLTGPAATPQPIIVIVGQEARAVQIRRMFDEIAPHYDARNRLFSVDRDRAWRRRAARRAGLRPGQTVLDLCTGTGKLAHELLPLVRPGGRVIGIDFSESMLQLARTLEPDVEFRQGDVSRLSEADTSVDAVTIGFGLRNLVDREGSLREMYRVLRPGARLVILELAPPTGVLMQGYRFYLDRVMPKIAGLFSRVDGQAYRYLAETVEGFPPPAALAAVLARIGFEPVIVERMTFGIVALHIATRPG
jgi:demethylmenaquinone methyltransferase / 2-methoxy-6-polyprenyl-1,4-benzoquinol methylase